MEESNEIRITGERTFDGDQPIVISPESGSAILSESRVQIEFDPETSTYRIGLAVPA